jgi:hypothetical protein
MAPIKHFGTVKSMARAFAERSGSDRLRAEASGQSRRAEPTKTTEAMRRLLLRPWLAACDLSVLDLPTTNILADFTLYFETGTDAIPVSGSSLISFASRCVRIFARAAE